MNWKKIMFVSGIAVATLGVAAACGHRHRFDESRAEKIVKHMDRKVSHLDLTAEQERKYQDLRGRILADLKEGIRERKTGLQKIKAEFQKNDTDIQAVAATMKQQISQGSARFEKMPDYIVEFYSMLDDKQKLEVKEEVLDRLEDL